MGAAGKKRQRPVKAGLSREVKKRLGLNVNRVADAWQPRFKREAKRQLEEDREMLLKILRKEGADAGRGWSDYFEGAGPERWQKGFDPLLRGVATDTFNTWEPFFTQAKMARKAVPETIFTEQAYQDYLITFAQPIMETTNLDCVAILETAAAEGWAIPEMETALDTLFTSYIEGGGLTTEQLAWFQDRLPKYRLENISRTETIKASNFASLRTYENFGVKYKEWLATMDNRTRPDHEDAMNRYSAGGNPGPIPINESFIVGGVPMMYPGDGPPEQICNCRCTSLPWSPAWG